jgi:hypothetical protein
MNINHYIHRLINEYMWRYIRQLADEYTGGNRTKVRFCKILELQLLAWWIASHSTLEILPQAYICSSVLVTLHLLYLTCVLFLNKQEYAVVLIIIEGILSPFYFLCRYVSSRIVLIMVLWYVWPRYRSKNQDHSAWSCYSLTMTLRSLCLTIIPG